MPIVNRRFIRSGRSARGSRFAGRNGCARIPRAGTRAIAKSDHFSVAAKASAESAVVFNRLWRENPLA